MRRTSVCLCCVCVWIIRSWQTAQQFGRWPRAWYHDIDAFCSQALLFPKKNKTHAHRAALPYTHNNKWFHRTSLSRTTQRQQHQTNVYVPYVCNRERSSHWIFIVYSVWDVSARESHYGLRCAAAIVVYCCCAWPCASPGRMHWIVVDVVQRMISSAYLII